MQKLNHFVQSILVDILLLIVCYVVLLVVLCHKIKYFVAFKMYPSSSSVIACLHLTINVNN